MVRGTVRAAEVIEKDEGTSLKTRVKSEVKK